MAKKHETKEIEQLERQIEELENQVKRTLADYQNLEKRVKQERHEWIKTANKDLLLRILPTLDTLITASKHVDDESLKISVSQFEDVLKTEGVEKIETIGHEFNPQTMECVATGEGEEDKVIEELQAGYMLHDRVLRPARVKVGKPVS